MLPGGAEGEQSDPWQAGDDGASQDGPRSAGEAQSWRERLIELFVLVAAQAARREAAQRAAAHVEQASEASEATRASQGFESPLYGASSGSTCRSKRGSPARSPGESPSRKRPAGPSASPAAGSAPASSQQPRDWPASARAKDAGARCEQLSSWPARERAGSPAAQSQQSAALLEQRSGALAGEPSARAGPGASEVSPALVPKVRDRAIATPAPAVSEPVLVSAASAPSPVMPVMPSGNRVMGSDAANGWGRSPSPPPPRSELEAPGSPVAGAPASLSPPAPAPAPGTAAASASAAACASASVAFADASASAPMHAHTPSLMPGPASAPAHAPAPAPARGPPAQLWPWHPEPEAAVKRLFNPVGGEIGGEIVAAATYWGSEPQQRSQIGRAGTFLSDALSERSASPPAAAEERGPPRLMPASSFTSSAGTSGSGRAGIGEEVVEDGFFPLLPKGVDIDGCEVEEGVRAVLKRLQPDQRMRQADEPAARRVLLEATKMGQQGPLARLAFELAAGAASARSDGADEEHGDTAALLGLALSTLPPEFPFDINQPAAGTLPAAHRSLQRVPSRLDELQLETYWQLLELPGFSQQQALFISALYPMLLNQDETHERLESLHGVKPLQMLALHMALENKLQHELRARGGVASQSSSGGTSSKGSLPSNVAAPLPFDARSLSHRAAGVELTPPKHLLKECSWFLLRAPLASGTGSSAAPVTATGATPRRRAEAVADLVTEVGNELIARWDLSRDGHLRARLVGHHALQDCEVDLVRLAFIRRDETMARFRIIDVMLVLGVAQDAPGAQADAEEVYTQCLELLDGLHRRADELEHGSSSLVARLTALRSDAPVTYVLGSASARALLASGLSAPLTPTQRSSSNSNSVYGSAASAARGPDG